MSAPTVIQGRRFATVRVGPDFVAEPLSDNVIVVTPGAGVPTIIDSVDITSIKGVDWKLMAIKGTNTWAALIPAQHDGTTPTWVEVQTNLSPGAGTFDFTYGIAIAGGLMTLTVTPTTGGWKFQVIRLDTMPA